MSSTFHALSSAAYESFMGRWSRRLSVPFIEFAGIANGESIIDVGCGTGSLTLALAGAADVGRIVGIDLSEVYLDHAKRNTDDVRVTFQKGDATAVDFLEATFDRAMSMLVLQFVPDADSAIREMKRVVRPRGMVAAARHDSERPAIRIKPHSDRSAAQNHPLRTSRRQNYPSLSPTAFAIKRQLSC